jgi:hypothetical protein
LHQRISLKRNLPVPELHSATIPKYDIKNHKIAFRDNNTMQVADPVLGTVVIETAAEFGAVREADSFKIRQ